MSGLRQIATEPANLDLRAGEKMDRSLHLRHHTKSQGGVSDSELSTETNSLSAESNNDNGRSPVKSTPSGGTESQATKSKQRRKGAEWEVIDSFKTLKIFDQAPPQLEGFMLKKRKWPLKGWHKVQKQLCRQELVEQQTDFWFYRGFSSWRKEVWCMQKGLQIWPEENLMDLLT